MILNDLERRNSPYFAFFTEHDSSAGRYVTVVMSVCKILSPSSSIPLLSKTNAPAARSFYDSWDIVIIFTGPSVYYRSSYTRSRTKLYTHRLTHILDAVHPIHVVSNHVDTDKPTTASGGTFTSNSAIAVANHVKARQSPMERAVTWLTTESAGWARSKRSAICSAKLCGGFIIFEQCCPCV